ncbi:MAG: hypothetical protein QOF76_5572, partial [Solirubrobacteraceae bacterium]|nr:hypothetical protein [Solirubrobacteraceae bacterium]
MTALGAIGRRLRAGETLADVQACATVEALGFCGFDRAIVLMVQDGRLVPQSDVPVADAASEALRRRALSGPLLVTAESDESELIRTAESIGRARRP